MVECLFPDKHRYESRRSARYGMAGLYGTCSAGPGRLVVFSCGGHWHIGHKRARG